MDTDNCCDWHAKFIAQNVLEEKQGHAVLVSLSLCPECNGLWKSYTVKDKNAHQEFLTERLWGVEREKYLSLYK